MRDLILRPRVIDQTWGVYLTWYDDAGERYYIEADNVTRAGLGSHIRMCRGSYPGRRIVAACRYAWLADCGSSVISVTTYDEGLPRPPWPLPVTFDPPGDLTEWYKIVKACRRSQEPWPVVDWMMEQGPEPFSRLLTGGDFS